MTWLVADALGCALPEQDVAFRKGKALEKYTKSLTTRVSAIKKEAAAAQRTGWARRQSYFFSVRTSCSSHDELWASFERTAGCFWSVRTG